MTKHKKSKMANNNNNLLSILFTFPVLVSIGLRLLLIHHPSLRLMYEQRIEVSTAANSWRNALEGHFLEQHNVSAYQGEVFHDTPLVLGLVRLLDSAHLLPYSWLLFFLIDTMTALFIAEFAVQTARFIAQHEKTEIALHKTSTGLLLTAESVESIGQYACLAYLLNPFTIASCGAQTTSTLSNLLLAAAFQSAMRNSRFLADLFLSLAAYQNLYAVALVAPLRCLLQFYVKGEKRRFHVESIVFHCALVALLWFCWCVMTLSLYGGFIDGVYGFQLRAADYRPSAALYWYFFAEMFDHFREFFLGIFILIVFAPTLPMCAKYWDQPEFALFGVLSWISIMRPYASVGEYGLFLALLPLFWHVMPYMRQLLAPAVCLVVSSVMLPIFWHQWIQVGAGNANFYYSCTLALNIALVLIVTDLMIANEKRQYVLRYGRKLQDDDAKADGVATPKRWILEMQ